MVENRVLGKTSNQSSPAYRSRYICCRYQYKNSTLKMLLSETSLQMRSNTKGEVPRAHTIQGGAVWGRLYGLRFYRVILPFERQILEMNGH